MIYSECQGHLPFLKQILALPCGDRTFFYTEAGHTYLCNFQVRLCNMKSVSAGGVYTFNVQMAQ